MFDSQLPQTPGVVPNNLPLGEPEDMFLDEGGHAPSAPSTVAEAPTGASEMAGPVMAAPVSAVSAGMLRPKQESIRPLGAGSAMDLPVRGGDIGGTIPPMMESPRMQGPMLGKRIVFLVVTLLFIALVGWGAWFAYQKITASRASSSVTSQTPTSNTTGTTNDTTSNITDTAPPATQGTSDVGTDNQVLFGEPVDTDGDRLDNDREASLGTDASNWDTDGDGLGDGDEVLVWKTSPLVSDTDGDGFADGMEVKSGYNPLGSGKLFVAPTATTTQ